MSVHLPTPWAGCLPHQRREDSDSTVIDDPGDVARVTCERCRDRLARHHLVTLRVTERTVTIAVPKDRGPAFTVEVDGIPVVGLLSDAAGYLALGHWPDGEEWEQLASTAYADPEHSD